MTRQAKNTRRNTLPIELRLVNVTDKLIHHLERQLDFFQKQHEFLTGKVERLELVVMAAKSDAGREYAERSDRAAQPAPRKTPITEVPIPADEKSPFKKSRERWNSLNAQQQEEAMKKADLISEEASKERAS